MTSCISLHYQLLLPPPAFAILIPLVHRNVQKTEYMLIKHGVGAWFPGLKLRFLQLLHNKSLPMWCCWKALNVTHHVNIYAADSGCAANGSRSENSQSRKREEGKVTLPGRWSAGVWLDVRGWPVHSNKQLLYIFMRQPVTHRKWMVSGCVLKYWD